MVETNVGDVSISALVVPKIAAPIQNFLTSDLQNLPYLQGLKIAHPVSSVEKLYISLLIGVDNYREIVGNHGKGPTAVQSKLGYLLLGPLPLQSEPESVPLHSYITQTLDLELSNCTESLTNSCLSTPTLSQQVTETSQPSRSFTCLYQQNCISRGHMWHDSLGKKTIPSFHLTSPFVTARQEL